MTKWIYRYLLFLVGLLINSFGIALITKGALGTSPISSVPYVLSLKFTNISFGMFTLFMNMGFILLEILLLRRDFQLIQLLQVVANILFSSFIDVSMSLLSFLDPQTIPVRLVVLLLGCAVLAFGLNLEVAPAVIMVPGEGIVKAISQVTKVKFGTVKNCFDITLMVIALILSLVFFGGLNGLGIGTLISAVLVGRLVALFEKRIPIFESIERWVAA